MSEHIVKIIPADLTYCITDKQAHCVVEFLKANIKADKIDVSSYASPVFIDCGSNLERIICPHCGVQLDIGWWSEVMDIASEGNFKNLFIVTPCCGKESTLNDLDYDFPCGFACLEFDIINPTTELCIEHQKTVEKLIEKPVRIIHSHL